MLAEEQDSWLKIIDDIFSLDMGHYDNLGFGDFAFDNLRSIIIGMVLGIVLASYLSIFNRRVHGAFISSVIDGNASTPATAKTLSELGYMKNSAIRSALRGGNLYRGIVRCVEAEEYYSARELARGQYEEQAAASGVRKPAFNAPEYTWNFETAHFYIPEDKHFAALQRFDKRGTGILGAILITLVSVVLLWAVLKILPDIMQYLDNFVGMIKG